MILVDTGPFVALFDPQDAEHELCKEVLQSIREPLRTTVPVLTETFHLLTPNSIGADRLCDFILEGGVSVWFLDTAALGRAFDLMDQYHDHPMDLADASLIVAAESLRITKIFTLDRSDFHVYRIRRGHHQLKADLLP
jgi:predicted nucleic acid-binding protein